VFVCVNVLTLSSLNQLVGEVGNSGLHPYGFPVPLFSLLIPLPRGPARLWGPLKLRKSCREGTRSPSASC
jgi:hypothetical protein